MKAFLQTEGEEAPSAAEQAEANRQYDEIAAKYKGTALWMKAPNGEPTKLSERQWVQARTANFKAVFGDWEKAGIRERLEAQEPVEVEAKYQAKSDKERRELAKALSIDFIANTSIGSVIVNKSSIKSSLQHGNTNRKLDVVEKLKEIIETSVFLDVTENFDGKGHTNYYLATRINRGSSSEIAFFRVRRTAGRGQKLYVHDVFLETEVKSQAPVSALDKTRQGAEGTNTNGHPREPALYKTILQESDRVFNLVMSKVSGISRPADIFAGHKRCPWRDSRGAGGAGWQEESGNNSPSGCFGLRQGGEKCVKRSVVFQTVRQASCIYQSGKSKTLD
ncbi:MAG: hypothetical protein NC211_09285 [Alistipes senegalensis]|nr:hypothetical protein [Oxalobacter formigenes]MCM1282001.1 hypothetical protein [Alistipes senegalensis]